MIDSNDTTKTICQIAEQAVTEERIRDYGHPRENFADIAQMWTIELRRNNGLQKPLTARQVGRMMIYLKMCRDMCIPKRDNLVDTAGFCKCMDLISQSPPAAKPSGSIPGLTITHPSDSDNK